MNGRRALGIMLVLPLIGMLMLAFTVQPCMQADVLEVESGMLEESWEEGWESSPVGVYHPYIPSAENLSLVTKFSGDTGDWYVEDTISRTGARSHPEYEEWSPNYAEIEETSEGKRLAITITYINSSVSDLWVACAIVPSIPLNENTSLSFTLYGSGFGAKGVRVAGICYTIHGKPSDGWGDNIPLEGDGGTYTRNVFDDYTNIPGNEYHGDERIGNIWLFIQDLSSDGLGTATFDDISLIYTRPSEPPPLVWIESCDFSGAVKDSFDLGETVHVWGSGFFPLSTMDFYIVDDVETWFDDMPIPARIPDTVTTITSDSSGDIPPTAVWISPQTIGKFDIIVDVLGDGIYIEREDVLDDGDVEESAGAQIIPEFPLLIVLPLFITATLLLVILYKRKRFAVSE